MAAAVAFDSGHSEGIQDCALDYYGKRLASCSSDRGIKVFELVGDKQAHLADLRGHEGPVWQVSWSHPKFGSLLASCSFDHRVIAWKEGPDNQWQQVFLSPGSLHSASVNSIAWAPHELGLLLAAGSSDGTISITEYSPATASWESTKVRGGRGRGRTGARAQERMRACARVHKAHAGRMEGTGVCFYTQGLACTCTPSLGVVLRTCTRLHACICTHALARTHPSLGMNIARARKRMHASSAAACVHRACVPRS